MGTVTDRWSNLSPEKRELLTRMLDDAGVDTSGLPIRPRGPDLNGPPLSYAQRSLWFMAQLSPDSAFYNIPLAVRLHGELAVDALQRAFETTLKRHEALRTRFPVGPDGPVQSISHHERADIIRVPLDHLPVPEREKQALKLATEEGRRPFDLAADIPIRAVLYRIGETDHLLLINTHHIASDGWSMNVLTQELASSYQAFLEHRAATLAPLPIQYPDYALWQRQWLRGPTLEEQLNYWQEQLRDVAPLPLPTDRPRPAVQSFRGTALAMDISVPSLDTLDEFCRTREVTLFMVLMCVFQSLLYRHCDRDDIVVGTPVAIRPRTELEGLIGFFANMLALRTNFAGNPTFATVLERVKQTTLDGFKHQDVPFEMLVEKLAVARDPSRNPVFQLVFALQDFPRRELALPGITIRPQALEIDTTHFDLEMHLWRDDNVCVAIFPTTSTCSTMRRSSAWAGIFESCSKRCSTTRTGRSGLSHWSATTKYAGPRDPTAQCPATSNPCPLLNRSTACDGPTPRVVH